VPNFVEIGQSIAELSRFFSNFKTAAVRRIYWSFQFFDILTFRRVRTAIVLNFIEIGQVIAEISRFDGFSKMADVRHLGF